MKKDIKSGFTIVEIIIVVTIIAVLSALAVTTYSGTRQDARNATRYGNVTIISEALEKYYEQNGEYPSVASIANTNGSNTGTAVSSKLSIPIESLKMPNMPGTATNAITSGTEPQNDYIVYIGLSTTDNNACQNDTNGSCDSYTLRYNEEGVGTREIESRRATRPAIAKPDLTVIATSSTNINASWSTVSGATSYTLQRSLSSNMSSPVSTTHSTTSSSISSLTANTTYYFSVQAITPSGSSDWSDVVSATTNGIAAPTGTLTITASMSGTNAVGTAGGGTCVAGTTIERQIRFSSTSTSTSGSWSTYTTGTPRSVAANQGWRYTFQQQARCTGAGGSSGWVSSGTSDIVRSISTVSAPTVTTSTSGNTTTWTASATSCPTGTTAQYIYRSLRDGGYTTTAWSSASSSNTAGWNTSSQGYNYTREFQTRCYTVHASGSWSATGSASYLRAVLAPAAPTNFVGTKLSSYSYEWDWTAPSCGPGTRGEMIYDAYIYGVQGNPWWWIPWNHQGWLSDPQANGAWWPSSHTYAPSDMTITRDQSQGPIPSGGTTRARVQYLCINTDTNRKSSYGPIGTSALNTVY